MHAWTPLAFLQKCTQDLQLYHAMGDRPLLTLGTTECVVDYERMWRACLVRCFQLTPSGLAPASARRGSHAACS